MLLNIKLIINVIKSTILTHNTRAQGPMIERTSQDATDIRIWRITCTL